MKGFQLLKAIGGVDEQLLMASEKHVPHISKRMVHAVVAAVLIIALSLSAVAVGIGLQAKGNTVSNTLTGQGKYVYDRGYIYYGERGVIRQISLEDGSEKQITLQDKSDVPVYLFTSEDYLYYVDTYDRLVRIRFDGTESETVWEGSFRRAYAEGSVLYSNDGESLCVTDLNTGEVTVLLDNCREYYVDGDNIYALTGEKSNIILRSDKNTIGFEEISLSFYPSQIVADGEDLYIAKFLRKGNYQIVHYRDGVETPLPIGSWHYQVFDGCILYLEDQTVKSYELATGRITQLRENVYQFSILEDRYICFDQCNAPTVILDWETGRIV